MNRFMEINQSLNRIYALLAELEDEYKNSLKGSTYYKRKQQLELKRDHLIKRAKLIGNSGSIAIIRGKRRRPQKRNPNLFTITNFELFVTGVSRDEIPFILNLHAKNAISYKVEFLETGKVYEN